MVSSRPSGRNAVVQPRGARDRALVAKEAGASLRRFVGETCRRGPWAAVEARVEWTDRSGRRRTLLAAAARREGRASPDERFDLASLTKPFVATLALVLEGSGELPLATRLGDLFPAASHPLARLDLESLLRHRSGLAAWAPLPQLAHDRSSALARLLDGRWLATPGERYSDLGFILWSRAAEQATGLPLDELLRERVLAPLDLERVEPSPCQSIADVVSCPLDNRREVELAAALGVTLAPTGPPAKGVVQDGNARFLSQGGGLAGHAGLFADVDSVVALAREWLNPRRLLTPSLVERALAGRGEYALGWARRRLAGSAGPALSAEAFGHTGFTGGSVWIDPRQRLVAVLLGHRSTLDVDLNRWRRRFHRLAASDVAVANAAGD